MRKHTFWMQDGEIWYGNDGGEEPEGEGRLFLEALEKLLFVVVDLAIGKEHLAQPVGFLGVDTAVAEHVLLDGLEEQRFKLGIDLDLLGLGFFLSVVAQLDEKRDFRGIDFFVGPQFFLQNADFGIVDFAVGQDSLQGQIAPICHN